MDRHLDSLAPAFRPVAIVLLARLVEARIPVLIINTFRTDPEQADAIARHVSWVTHSKHQDGLAIDLVPYATFILHGESKLDWDASDPVWAQIGAIGEGLGLRWGGRWAQKDLGHFELA